MVGNQQQQRKGRWTSDEDKLLNTLVADYNESDDIDWSVLEQSFKGTRDSKQIRERWVNHLNPQIKKRKFNETEIKIIEDECSKHRFKWAKISKKIPNATPLMIKNFYNNRLKKKNTANRRPSNQGTINYTSSNFNNTTTTTTTKTTTTNNTTNTLNINPNLINDNYNYYNSDISYYNKSNLSRTSSSKTDRTMVSDGEYHTSLSRNSSISSTKTMVENTPKPSPLPSPPSEMLNYTIKDGNLLSTLAQMADMVRHVESPPTDKPKQHGKMSIMNLLNTKPENQKL